MQNLLFSTKVPIADGIEFQIRTLGEIIEFGEVEYFQAISVFLCDPFEYMYSLYQAGIDYETIDEFQLFITLRSQLTPETMEFLFGDTLSFEGMEPAVDNETEQIVLVDPSDETRIFTSTTLFLIAETIRKIHYIKYEKKKAGNAEAKQYFLELAAKRARRNKNKKPKSVLENSVIALVNTPEFPYNYNTCQEVTIYQFFTSLRQIPKRLSWHYVMHGVHVGMIDSSKVSWRELDWLSNGPSPS